MTQAELLRRVFDELVRLNIPAMLVGSYASSFYGEARSTHDIDIVIDLPVEKIPDLIKAFPASRYYLSEVALKEGRMAKLIDTKSGNKVDLFCLRNSARGRRAFSRKVSANVLGVNLHVASVEDTFLAKEKTMIEDYEDQIAKSTEAGREALRVWDETVRKMTGPQKVEKSFELTEITREFMRAGLKHQFPNATESEIHRMYIDRLLGYHGYSLAEIRGLQKESQNGSRS